MELVLLLWVYLTVLILASVHVINCGIGEQFRTESTPENSEMICAYNKCSSEPKQCLNGGSCVFDQRTCKSSCRCVEGYSGSMCQKRDTLVREIKTELKIGSFDENNDQDELQSISTTEKPDSRHNICKGSAIVRPDKERACTEAYICKYGVCEVSDVENDVWTGKKYDCMCDIGAVGLKCEERCCLDCDHGTCAVHNGTEFCSCKQHYKGPKCEEYVPVPVKIKVHEVTWYLWVIGACAAAFLIMVGLSVVIPYYMWKHRVILIMKIVHYFQAYEDDDDKQWDAFISYKAHAADEHFVVHSLYPKLEQELGFKLNLHFRDFIPGETISNNIINAVEGSRRTIIILSPRYIQSEFTRFEYQKAQQEMLKMKHRIIPILLEDISSLKSGMDKNLKGIIDSVTYLEWPGTSCEKKLEKFWKRLILSMPKKKESTFESNIVTSVNFDSKLPSLCFDSNKISSSNFGNTRISSSSVNVTANNGSIVSPAHNKCDSNRVTEWLSTINDKIDQSEESENIYCEIGQIDEKLTELNIPVIPTLSEQEEEDIIEKYQRSLSIPCNGSSYKDSERESDMQAHLTNNCEGRCVMQTQLSFSQSEVSSTTDSQTPLWVDKAEGVEEKPSLKKFLNILDSVTEV